MDRAYHPDRPVDGVWTGSAAPPLWYTPPPRKKDVMEAASTGDVESLKEALKDWEGKEAVGKHPAVAKDFAGRTTLQWAAASGKIEAVELLLAAGADKVVSNADVGGETALMWAAGAGASDCVRALVEAGAVVGATDGMGCTALTSAARSGAKDAAWVIHYLLSVSDIPVDAVDGSGKTLVHTAAHYGATGIVKLLTTVHGASVDTADVTGTTPLQAAASDGAATSLAALVAAGAEATEQELKATPRWAKACVKAAVELGADCKLHPDVCEPWEPWAVAASVFFLSALPFYWPWWVPFVVVPLAMPFLLKRMAMKKLMDPTMRTGSSPAFVAAAMGYITLTWLYKVVPVIGGSHSIATMISFGLWVGVFVGYYVLCAPSGTKAGIVPGNQETRDKALAAAAKGETTPGFCWECLVRTPVRGHHCRTCETCVSRFDHHCMWINGCVGGGNAVVFCIWLLDVLCTGLMMAYMFLTYFYTIGNGSIRAGMSLEPGVAWMFFWGSLNSSWMGIMGLEHARRATKNLTTWEEMAPARLPYIIIGAKRKLNTVFDLGSPIDNVKAFFDLLNPDIVERWGKLISLASAPDLVPSWTPESGIPPEPVPISKSGRKGKAAHPATRPGGVGPFGGVGRVDLGELRGGGGGGGVSGDKKQCCDNHGCNDGAPPVTPSRAIPIENQPLLQSV